ncbi:OLC1v1038306C1 [Oldenlandia corymbosa var. corymbosa]|uniref:OLC1v1038306C1 n=1 Tax=Oldenlandia corymbosa var. corymbosa TaxID=529605 RepID=A0AAV1CZG0_OLDCO|nr:OLC1v1038306C1 [Oldenlandia corymbosa var. corymbosa]
MGPDRRQRTWLLLVLSDFIMSFMWVWSSVLIKMFVYTSLGFHHHNLKAEILKNSISVINMFLFAYLAKLTNGGAYNPLTVLSSAISGNFPQFLFVVGARIPAQVFGSISGVRLIRETFPTIGTGPKLSVDIHQGALTEGTLTFLIVIVSLGLSRNIPGSFYMKTWISSLSKLTLHVLGSDLTGGCMNPASVMGWAYARGDHITKEHILVYWLAPIEATLLANFAFKLLVVRRQEKEKKLEKTE